MRITKILEISLQNEAELLKAHEINEKDNFDYIIKVKGNLVRSELLLKIKRLGYKIFEEDNTLAFYKER